MGLLPGKGTIFRGVTVLLGAASGHMGKRPRRLSPLAELKARAHAPSCRGGEAGGSQAQGKGMQSPRPSAISASWGPEQT